VGAIVVAAGESSRMMGIDKIFAPLDGNPLIYHSLRVLHDSTLVSEIALVMSEQNIQGGRRLVGQNGWHKVVDVCTGGERRQDSVMNGLKVLPSCDWIIVHDGARPLIDERMILEGLAEAQKTGASVAGVPSKDTIKSVDEDMNVIETLPREKLWIIQTPQIFSREVLLNAHEQINDDVTDDASMVERIFVKTRIFMGSCENIKITTPEDLFIAEAIIRARTPIAGAKQ
jgi:2-C-methyl-D-erythritol 4-phosphate cytidylyltransferase